MSLSLGARTLGSRRCSIGSLARSWRLRPRNRKRPAIISKAVHDARGQIVFVDTPGIFTSSRDRLSKSLNASAEAALKDVDIIVHVVDPTRAIGPRTNVFFSMLDSLNIPKILVINKMDVHRPPTSRLNRKRRAIKPSSSSLENRGTHWNTHQHYF